MRNYVLKRFWETLAATAAVLLLLTVLVVACDSEDGEDRPSVEVISETGSVSGSVSGTGTGTVTVGAMPSAGDEHYTPVSNVTPHANLALDMRDIAGLLSAATRGETVDYAAITDIYENGRHADGRTLEGYATGDSVLAEFPGDIDLDANVRAGLTGNWAGRQVSDLVRRQIINKSLQAIIFGKVQQELSSARAQMEAGNLDDASGAPHKVDEGWAFYVGAPDDEGNRNYSIAATARSRAGNFDLHGKVDPPIQHALADALEASRAGDLNAFDAAAAEVRAGLNTIFYLATLRYAKKAFGDEDTSARAQHLAEGWAFFQPIHPIVRGASTTAAATIQAIFLADPADPMSQAALDRLYAVLNDTAVVADLGIPAGLIVTDPARAN